MKKASRFHWLAIGGAALFGCSHDQATRKVEAPPAPPPVARSADPQPAAPAELPAPGEDSIYFDFDASVVREDARPVLQRVAERASKTPSAHVRIEGNCDERGTEEYNLALGAHRAESAKKYLQQLGVAAPRIETVSFGSERPKSNGHDESAWSKNRRDDFAVR